MDMSVLDGLLTRQERGVIARVQRGRRVPVLAAWIGFLGMLGGGAVILGAEALGPRHRELSETIGFVGVVWAFGLVSLNFTRERARTDALVRKLVSYLSSGQPPADAAEPRQNSDR